MSKEFTVFWISGVRVRFFFMFAIFLVMFLCGSFYKDFFYKGVEKGKKSMGFLKVSNGGKEDYLRIMISVY